MEHDGTAGPKMDSLTRKTEASCLLNKLKLRIMPEDLLSGDPNTRIAFKEGPHHVNYRRNRSFIGRVTSTKKERVFVRKSQDFEYLSQIIYSEQTLPNGVIKIERNNHRATSKAHELIEGVPLRINNCIAK